MAALKLTSGIISGCQNVFHRAVVSASLRCRQPERFYSRTEPDDLVLEPEIPEYDEVVVKMHGYDYVVLESFLKYVHSLARGFKFEAEAYPAPPRTSKINTYKPFSTTVDNEYELALYERTVKLSDLRNTLLPLFMEAIQQNTPEGVSVTVKVPDPIEEDFRYVPDMMIKQLQSHIEDIDQAREDRRK